MKRIIIAVAVGALGVGLSARRGAGCCGGSRNHDPSGRVSRNLVRLRPDEPRRDWSRVDHARQQRSGGWSRGRRHRQARRRTSDPAREGPGRQGHRHRALQRDGRCRSGMVLRRGLRPTRATAVRLRSVLLRFEGDGTPSRLRARAPGLVDRGRDPDRGRRHGAHRPPVGRARWHRGDGRDVRADGVEGVVADGRRVDQ